METSRRVITPMHGDDVRNRAAGRVCVLASDTKRSQHVAVALCMNASDRTRSGMACMYQEAYV
jgi:hypothetical protein